MLSIDSSMLDRPALKPDINRAVLRHCFGNNLPAGSILASRAVEAENIFQLTTYLNLIQLKYRCDSKLLPILYTVKTVSRILDSV